MIFVYSEAHPLLVWDSPHDATLRLGGSLGGCLRGAEAVWFSVGILAFVGSAVTKICWRCPTKFSIDSFWAKEEDSGADLGFRERGWIAEMVGYWIATMSWVIEFEWVAVAFLTVLVGVDIADKL